MANVKISDLPVTSGVADANEFEINESGSSKKVTGLQIQNYTTNSTTVEAAGALMDSELTDEAAVKTLDQGVATTDSPEFAGLTVDTESDGEIVQFRKDNSIVGRIGNQTSRLYLGSGDVGAAFQSDVDKRFYPVDPSSGGVGKDAYIDLGRSNVRWKDFYLSGGVYLGGTGAANYLDDYETGTFTPFIYGETTSGTGAHSTQRGYYTKIGRQVNVEIRVQVNSHTGTGAMRVGGLPFTIASDINGMPLAFTAENLSITAGHTERAYFASNSTSINLISIPTGGGGPTDISVDGSCLLTLRGFYHV